MNKRFANEMTAKKIQDYLNERFITHKKHISSTGTVYIRFLSLSGREYTVRISDHPMKANHELKQRGIECFNVGTYKHGKGIKKCLKWINSKIDL